MSIWILPGMNNMNESHSAFDSAVPRNCSAGSRKRAQRSLGEPRTATPTTIEGLAVNGEHPLQIAWAEHNVPQCGYCQPGQIMQAAALLADNANPSDADIDAAMSGNICRCGTYQRIREAIRSAAEGAA